MTRRTSWATAATPTWATMTPARTSFMAQNIICLLLGDDAIGDGLGYLSFKSGPHRNLDIFHI